MNRKLWSGGVFLAFLVLAVLLVLQGKKAGDAGTETEKLQAVTCSIRTGHWEEGCPMQYVLTSEKEFGEFSGKHFQIGEEETFVRQIGEGDASFFEKYVLFCALVTSGSGLDRYEVSDIRKSENGEVRMTVTRKAAKTGTADMAEWFLFARVERDELEVTPERLAVRIEEKQGE